MSEKISLGKLISGRRKHMGLTQAELGAKIGVSKSAVAKWETDGGIPCLDNLGNLYFFLICHNYSLLINNVVIFYPVQAQ